MSNLHHCSAKHGHDDHEEPAGNQVKEPKNIADRSGQSVLGKPAVKRMENAVMELACLSVSILLQLYKIVTRNGSQVQALGIEIDGSWLRSHLEDPESTSGCRPGVA